MLRTFRPTAITATGLKAFAAALFALMLLPATASAQEVELTEAELKAEQLADAESARLAEVAEAGRDQLPAIGIGLAVIGGGLGIGLCGFAATGAMARQPEIAGQIQTAMLIAAVLVEGATIIGLAFCLAV